MRSAGRHVAVAVTLLAAGPAAWASTHTVVIEDMQFKPATLTVKRGDRVVWVNRDVVPHNARDGKGLESPDIAPGGSWSTAVNKAGQLSYLCTLHPMMKATLVVK